MFMCLYVVYDHFHFITSELNSCDVNHMTQNVVPYYSLAFYRKTLANPGVKSQSSYDQLGVLQLTLLMAEQHNRTSVFFQA